VFLQARYPCTAPAPWSHLISKQRVDAGEKLFGLREVFKPIRDLGKIAEVWVQFNPSFMEISQGSGERESAFLKRKRLVFHQEEEIVAKVQREIEMLQ
jgi:hypothetical protein